MRDVKAEEARRKERQQRFEKFEKEAEERRKQFQIEKDRRMQELFNRYPLRGS